MIVRAEQLSRTHSMIRATCPTNNIPSFLDIFFPQILTRDQMDGSLGTTERA